MTDRATEQRCAAPTPLAVTLDALIGTLQTLRHQLAEMVAPPADEWIGQRQGPLRPRVHARLCRELLARGDERAALRGRVHYLRQSAIDEHLRGAPRAKKRRLVESAMNQSAGDRLLAELGGQHG